MPGYVTAAELGRLYERAWVVAVPSRFESASFPVWEGFRQGKPAVVAKTTSLPDQVGNGGLTVEQGDVDGFASAIGRIIKDDALARELGEAGRRTVSALSWRRTALATALRSRMSAQTKSMLARGRCAIRAPGRSNTRTRSARAPLSPPNERDIRRAGREGRASLPVRPGQTRAACQGPRAPEGRLRPPDPAPTLPG